jgi:hypothetical protein
LLATTVGIEYDKPHSEVKAGHCGYTDECGHGDCIETRIGINITPDGIAHLVAMIVAENSTIQYDYLTGTLSTVDCDSDWNGKVALPLAINNVIAKSLRALKGEESGVLIGI